MDIKDLKGLLEAYQQVHAPQDIEEGLRSAVKKFFGGGKKEAEAPKPESRGEQLRKKYNVGPEKSDTSAKRQILDRSRARAERDQERYGDKPFQKQVAQKSKAAHDRYLKAGYSKYGADDARGKGNKARRKAATLNREDFEFIVNSLVEEGYNLSSYTWDEMYDLCVEEMIKLDEAKQTFPFKKVASKIQDKLGRSVYARTDNSPVPNVTDAEKKATAQMSKMARVYSKEKRAKQEADKERRSPTFYKDTHPASAPKMAKAQREEFGIDEAVKGADSEMRRMAAVERKGGDKRLSPSKGKGYADHQKQSISYMDKVTKKNKNVVGLVTKEGLDIFDVVLEFLQAEGYAETLEEAQWLMANVIDEEAIGIILGEEELDEASRRDEFTRAAIARSSGRKGGITFEPGPNWDASANRGKGAHLSPKQKEKQRRKALRQEDYVNEAQAARENPEKYEAGEKKKYAPVRGERTPMPPRGDKRREDFEKWYAKNVR